MSEYYRPGHLARPDREWEVWDERWLRQGSERREGLGTLHRWVVHHPIEMVSEDISFCDLDFETLDEALAFIAEFEVAHADELAEWRS